MTAKVGAQGQVVIDKRIRDELGVRPGMIALQRRVGDHVEIRFVPEEHARSLAGAARPYIRRWPSGGELEDLGAVWAEGAMDLPDSDAHAP